MECQNCKNKIKLKKKKKQNKNWLSQLVSLCLQLFIFLFVFTSEVVKVFQAPNNPIKCQCCAHPSAPGMGHWAQQRNPVGGLKGTIFYGSRFLKWTSLSGVNTRNYFGGEHKCVYSIQITPNRMCINLYRNRIIFIVSISFISHLKHTLDIKIGQYVNNGFALLSALSITYLYIYV